jgi:surfactin synthase thioesterase subunit
MTTLICLPFAGAHVDPFFGLRRACERELPGLVSLTHTYPGHGRRLGENPLPTIEEMADDCLATIAALGRPGDPVILLGYSMGVYVAYEAALRLSALGRRMPLIMFMAATPPHRLTPTDLVVTTDEELLAHCLQYGLLRSTDFPTPQLRELFLPALRNDILAVDAYANAGPPPRALPARSLVGVFHAERDQTVTDVKHWGELCTVAPDYFLYQHGHFFINDTPDLVQRDVLSLLPGAGDTSGRDMS